MSALGLYIDPQKVTGKMEIALDPGDCEVQ